MFVVLAVVNVVLSGVADVPYYPIGIQMYGVSPEGGEFPCNRKHSSRGFERTTGVRSGHAPKSRQTSACRS